MNLGNRLVMLKQIATALTLFAVGAAAPLFAQQAASGPTPPPGPGLEIIQRSCINCHDINMIISQRKTPDDWADTIGRMADRGAEVTPEEMELIQQYLSEHFATGEGSEAKP
ncbi:MAG: hypothetical protein ACJ8OJ_03665 [Povalibacter sp.]